MFLKHKYVAVPWGVTLFVFVSPLSHAPVHHAVLQFFSANERSTCGNKGVGLTAFGLGRGRDGFFFNGSTTQRGTYWKCFFGTDGISKPAGAEMVYNSYRPLVRGVGFFRRPKSVAFCETAPESQNNLKYMVSVLLTQNQPQSSAKGRC